MAACTRFSRCRHGGACPPKRQIQSLQQSRIPQSIDCGILSSICKIYFVAQIPVAEAFK